MTEHHAPYGIFSGKESRTPLERVFEAAGCRTQVELAIFLNIRQSSVSDAKRRNAIPAEWLIKILRRTGINPEWILTGQGPKRLGPANDEPVAQAVSPHGNQALRNVPRKGL